MPRWRLNLPPKKKLDHEPDGFIVLNLCDHYARLLYSLHRDNTATSYVLLVLISSLILFLNCGNGV